MLSQAESAQQRLADLDGVARVSSARVVAQLLLEYAHAKMNSDDQTNLRSAVSAMCRLQRQRSVGARAYHLHGGVVGTHSHQVRLLKQHALQQVLCMGRAFQREVEPVTSSGVAGGTAHAAYRCSDDNELLSNISVLTL